MITLASDFQSPYPAAMKGVILDRTDARLVDIAHDFPRHDVRAGAFWLREVLLYFPQAVHLVVIDPGVGTDRKAIVLRAGGHALVGPDNGVLRPVARRFANEAPEPYQVDAFVIDDADAASSTFHGRDVFAPAAAAVHSAGVDACEGIEQLTGTSIDDLVDLRFPTPTIEDERAAGEIIVVDGFGNCVTNVPGRVVADWDWVEVDGELVPVAETFDTVPPGDRLATVGSHGNVELDVNRGRGDEAFGFEVGDEVELAAADR